MAHSPVPECLTWQKPQLLMWIDLDMVVNHQHPDGARGKGLSLMSDNGCRSTSVAFMEACSPPEIHRAFTSYNNPKGNAATELFRRTLKEEYLWLQEWTCPLEPINGFAH
jgi:putative transposase